MSINISDDLRLRSRGCWGARCGEAGWGGLGRVAAGLLPANTGVRREVLRSSSLGVLRRDLVLPDELEGGRRCESGVDCGGRACNCGSPSGS